MSIYTVENIILLAKQRRLDELEKLSTCTEFVETIGWIIHQIQIERGLSCLYLASYGQRLAESRAEMLEANHTLEGNFKEALQSHLDHNRISDAKQLTLISWILLGFDELKSLRYKVTLIKIPFSDCIQSYNRFISSLISLIFEITDSTVNTKLSTYLLALYNLVQGKEFAGQERAVGSYLFGSGHLQLIHQQKLIELIALQDRHFEVFCQFGNQALRHSWETLQNSTLTNQHELFRKKLTTANDQQILQTRQGDQWFDLCSRRLVEMWQIQGEMIQEMRHTLQMLVEEAKADLEKTKRYLEDFKAKSKTIDNAFYNLAIPVETAFSFLEQNQTNAYPIESVMALLQQQSQQIAEMENELSETKKALSERKQNERAKGVLMSTMAISEVDAYKVLRSTAMEQNRKIIDVAQNILLKQSV